MSLGGDLVIDSNELLADVQGLTSLNHVSNLMVKGIDIYMDIVGFLNLREVRGSLSFEDSK